MNLEKEKFGGYYSARVKHLDMMSTSGFTNVFWGQLGRNRFQSLAKAVQQDDRRLGEIESYSVVEDCFFPILDMFPVCDILCKFKSNTLFVLERMNYFDPDFDQRNAKRLMRVAASHNVWEEKPFNDKCYGISLSGVVMHPENTDYINIRHGYVDYTKKRGQIQENIHVLLEIPKFNKGLTELESELDKWMFLFKNIPHLSRRPDIFDSPTFKDVFDELRLQI